MKKTEPLQDCYFLNRLALNEMANARSVDPLRIINGIFEFGEPDDMKRRLAELCDAALSEDYAGKGKSPANLLFFCEQLEALVEACFLIHTQQNLPLPGETKAKTDGRKAAGQKSEEPGGPVAEIASFFHYHSLPEWKRILHDWMEAALSGYSIVETIEPGALLAFPRQLEKLVEAAFLLSGRKAKKK